MCGELKIPRGADLVKGKTANLITKDNFGLQAIWNGHGRSETLYKWTGQGWKVGYLADVVAYTEGHAPPVEFKVPEGKHIKVIYRDDIATKPFNIVTRPATLEEQAKAKHDRFPVIE
ncbi:MAG TPA: hypothetical protein VKR58_02645 [Aquella sp.]|nr:hypothetical protein [Aquella sp.]